MSSVQQLVDAAAISGCRGPVANARVPDGQGAAQQRSALPADPPTVEKIVASCDTLATVTGSTA